jgi:hypothetical protein
MPRRERPFGDAVNYIVILFGTWSTAFAISSVLRSSFDIGFFGLIGAVLDFYEWMRGDFADYILAPIGQFISQALSIEMEFHHPWTDVAVITMSYAIIQAKDSLLVAHHRCWAVVLRILIGFASVFLAYGAVSFLEDLLGNSSIESVLVCTTVAIMMYRILLSFQIAGDRTYGHWGYDQPARVVFIETFLKKIRTCLVPLYCFFGSLLFNFINLLAIDNQNLVEMLSFLTFFPLMGYAHIQMNGGIKGERNTGNFEIAVMLFLSFGAVLFILLLGSNS